MFRQTTKTKDESGVKTNQEIKIETNSNYQSHDKSQRLWFSKDSVKDKYAIRFWPKGVLKFSPYGGLEGEFDSVLMSGNLNMLRSSSEILNNDKNQKAIASSSLVQNSSSNFWRNQEEKLSQGNWKWVVAGIILLLLGLVWFIWERFFLKK